MAKQICRQFAKEELGIRVAKQDLNFFSEYCWKDDPKNKPNGLFHKEWYYILQADPSVKLPEGSDASLRQDLLDFIRTRRLHIEAPREHAKTTCISVKYPLWMLGNNPNLNILIVSKTATLATDIIRECKLNIERNERLHMVFPELQPINPWTDKEFTISWQ